MPDRTVHAITAQGDRIVRYDRAGKWYVEDVDGGNVYRIPLDEAVEMATQRGSAVFLGKAGGTAFDRRVVKTMLERAQ